MVGSGRDELQLPRRQRLLATGEIFLGDGDGKDVVGEAVKLVREIRGDQSRKSIFTFSSTIFRQLSRFHLGYNFCSWLGD